MANSEAIYRALIQYGAPMQGFTPADFRDHSAFQIGMPPARIDLLQQIDGVSFDRAWENRVTGMIDGEVQASVVSKDDSIWNKTVAERDQDLLDLKKLHKSDKAKQSNR